MKASSNPTPCVVCGVALEPGARFCGGCGSAQPEPAAARPAAPARAAQTIFQGSGWARPPAQPQPQAVEEAVAPITLVDPPASAPPLSAPSTSARFAVSAREEDLTGTTLNKRYLIEARIGEGGFGAVYRARQTAMNRTVALKVLHRRMASDPQVVGRFRREAQASSLLRAPHTVQVYDFDQTTEGVLYLAMEMLEGVSLHRALFDEGPFEPLRMARIMEGIAASLGEAHAQGIVHRDVKPENVFLEPRPAPDFVKVLDFGIAKIVAGDGLGQGPALTAVGQTLGTLEYMSPEQLMGGQLDGRSDLYALGVLSYEMLTGELPFSGKTAADIISGHLKKIPPPPSSRPKARAIPPLLDAIVLKLLAKTREQRYRDTDELRAELGRVLATSERAAPRLTPGSSRKPTVVTPAGLGMSRGTWLLIAGLSLGVLIVIASLVWLSQMKG